jgi:hypothetical protein
MDCIFQKSIMGRKFHAKEPSDDHKKQKIHGRVVLDLLIDGK